RHGKLGSVAGILVGVANGLLKPVVGTFSSLTWFCRGIYANISNEALLDKGHEACPIKTLGLDSLVSTMNNEESKQQYTNDTKQVIKIASTISGFSPDVCQQIITEFDNIKKHNIDYRSYKHKSR
ncbi:unnamed protein product, partial [Rotaria sp. Silwood1]